MLTMYSTTWCGYCHRLKRQLDREGIEFSIVDIEQEPTAARIVERANNGNQTVPRSRRSSSSRDAPHPLVRRPPPRDAPTPVTRQLCGRSDLHVAPTFS
jgi:mycoredoxin